MELVTDHMYKKLSTGFKYILRKVEHEKKKDIYVLLDGLDNSARRVELAVFRREYRKVRIIKKTGS